MKRVVYLAAAAIVAMLILMPMVMAQSVEPKTTTKEKVEAKMTQEGPLPSSGGPVIASPSVLLPAAALLVGSGILTYAVVRRRR
jgi:hypothetical protein